MDQLISEIQKTCAGLDPDEIEQQILASENAAAVPDAEGLARYFAAIAQSAAPAEPPSPDQAETPEQTGNEG